MLDVGSGTGVVTEELAARTQGQVIGVDLDPAMVAYAQGRGGRAEYRPGDAHDLPFGDGWFDVTACHFVLLWCRDPARAGAEMVRVTRPGGAVLVCAEPDYGGRIDHPDLPLGDWQMEALRREGADPCLGRKLRGLFALPAVRSVEVGLIPGLWDPATLRAEFDAEWALWERSLAGLVPADELARVKAADRAAIEAGSGWSLCRCSTPLCESESDRLSQRDMPSHREASSRRAEEARQRMLIVLVAVLGALIPTLFYVLFVWWLDRYEKEPLWLLALAFLWGAVPAALLSVVFELILDIPLGAVGGESLAANLISVSVSAPLIEESVQGDRPHRPGAHLSRASSTTCWTASSTGP